MIVPYGSAGMFPTSHDLSSASGAYRSAIRPGGVLAHQWIESHSRSADRSSHRSRRRCLLPLPNSSTATAEILITKNSLASSARDLYQAPIGYVTQPKKKRDELFVAAEVCPANLAISSIFLPCKALREYFYRIPEREGPTGRQTLYGVLQVPGTASPSSA
jgi:hypothetical protein